ncbi:unnamed protein product [Tuber aestivum]|uniref:Rho-GAP domain-containing protein n=1 Tax=Tuber aestivum TaxID=59557 RepID=A0A292Q6L5_9PEZI|nr:unnamed protein product [Tuber aestivum]
MSRRSPPPGSSARSTFNRFKDSMPDRFNSLQSKIENRISQVPDKLSQVPDKLSQVPDKFQDFRRETQAQLPRSISPASVAKAPEEGDPKYDHALAGLAAKILYRAGACPISGGPLLVLCAASFPDTRQLDYNELLPYVLSILPGDDELGEESDGGGYSVVFFAGGGTANVGGKEGGAGAGKGNRPSWAWTLQAYHLIGQLGRAVKKRIRKLWVVHERAWVRVILEVMAGVVSVKFRKKVVHVNTLTDLANHIDITQLHIPPAVYLHDRKLVSAISIPDPPSPIFGRPPFHTAANPPRVGENMPLPQVLIDTARYLRSQCLSVEGLFRVTPSQALLDVAREAYDRKQYIKWDEWGPHMAAALVKLYYRSLPEPLIPMRFYQDLLSLEEAGAGDEKAFLKVKDLLDDGLPKSSRVLLLRHLLPLLALVAQNSAVNKMNPNNLAVCIAPSLLKSDDMMADAKACNGLRTFIQIAIERVEELAPELPSRDGPVRSGSGSGSSATGVPPPSGSPPPYSMGSMQPVQRKKLPGIMGTKEMEGGMTARKPVPDSASSSVTYLPLANEPDEKSQLVEKAEAEERKEDIRRSPTPGLPAEEEEAPRRGSVLSIPTRTSEGILRRKASFQSLTNNPPEIGPKPPILSSSSLIPDPSPPSPITKPPRVIRRAASSTFPSSSSPRSSSFSSPSVASIASSLNQSQVQKNAQLKSRTPPPPVIQRAKTEVGSMKGRGKVVEELRALYEERAKGVEVLVRNTPGRLKGKGKE